MSSLKAKIVKQLDYLPDDALKQVSVFIDFLTWRKMADLVTCYSLLKKDSLKTPDLPEKDGGSVALLNRKPDETRRRIEIRFIPPGQSE